MKIFAVLALMCTFAFGQVHQSASQLTVIPLETPTFSGTVGANQTWTPSAYGVNILRCTDVNTSADPGELHGYEETESGGSSDIEWNANGRLLTVIFADGGNNITIPFDPVAFTCGQEIPGSKAPNGRVWSNTDPNTDYTLNGTVVSARTFNWQNPQQAPVSTVLFDFTAVCPGLPPAANILWHSPMWLTIDDSVFAIAFSDLGHQDTGEWLALYQPRTGGCQTWNTLTGAITANGFGQTGTPSTFYPFTIHDIEMGYGGVIHMAIGSTCTGCPRGSGFLFKAGGLTANWIFPQFGGHNNVGYSKYINSVNGVNFVGRDWTDTANPTLIDQAKIPWPAHSDTHVSWKNDDVLDSYPFMVGSVSLNQPQPLQITVPLEQENVLINFDGTFTRISPTMDSGITNPYNFRTVNAIGSIAKQGYYAWSSDVMGQLGNTDGVTQTCTLGAAVPDACRSDVFIVIPY